MKSKNGKQNRSKQILELLLEFGSLSSKALRELLEPRIESRALRNALQRLEEQQLIQRRKNSLESPTTIYQLNPREFVRKKLLKKLDIKESELKLPLHRFECIDKLESIAFWTKKLRQALPGILIVNRLHYQHDPYSKDVIRFEQTRRYELPDMLLRLPIADDSKKDLHIVIDVGEHINSNLWPYNKLKLYATNSAINGYLMLLSEVAIEQLIGRFRKFRWLPNRKNTYGEFFWMFSTDILYTKENGLKLTSLGLKSINLQDWLSLVELFQSTSTKKRMLKKVHQAER